MQQHRGSLSWLIEALGTSPSPDSVRLVTRDVWKLFDRFRGDRASSSRAPLKALEVESDEYGPRGCFQELGGPL